LKFKTPLIFDFTISFRRAYIPIGFSIAKTFKEETKYSSNIKHNIFKLRAQKKKE
jgi:hypothetical protein